MFVLLKCWSTINILLAEESIQWNQSKARACMKRKPNVIMVYVMDRRSEKNSLFFCLGLTTIGQMVGNGNRHNYWLSHVHQTTQDQQQTNSDYSNCRIVELVKHMKSTFVWRSVSNIIEIIHMILKSAAFFRPFPF